MAQVTYPFPVQYCQIQNGIRIAYMDEGHGDQVVLFIHGLANYGPVWKYQIQQLKPYYRCIALDLPGNGLSPGGDFTYSLVFYAECVMQFIQKLGLQSVVLCGHSMGGQIATMLTLRYPERVSKLVLVAAAGLEVFQPHEVLLMKHLMQFGDMWYADEIHMESAIRNSFYATQNESEGILSDLSRLMRSASIENWRLMCKASIRAMLDEPVYPFLYTLQVPVLILMGKYDALIPNRLIHIGETPAGIVEKATKRIPCVTSKIIEQSGHFVQMESYVEVNTELINFINDSKSG